MRKRSALKECASNQQQQRYYENILSTIDQIELTLLHKLTQTQPSRRPKRCMTPSYSQCHTKRPATPKSQKINKSRVQTEAEEIPSVYSTMFLRSSSRKGQKGLHMTPKKGNSSKEIQGSPFGSKGTSPFDQYEFNTIQTIKRNHNTPKLQKNPSKELKSKGNLFELKDCYQQKHSKHNNKGSAKKRKVRGDQNSNYELQGRMDGDIGQLQSEFQGCLMQKKQVRAQQRECLRKKMTELSYRIAKIRERQSRTALYL